jgi:DNA-binding XRE family transcriptional regulator
MAGRHKYDELRKRMSPQRRRRNDLAVRRELRHMLLSELRRLAGLTQEELAGAMGITQPTLSTLERQSDIRLSTLRRIVEALGGELEVVAKLPQGRVPLTHSTPPRHVQSA